MSRIELQNINSDRWEGIIVCPRPSSENGDPGVEGGGRTYREWEYRYNPVLTASLPFLRFVLFPFSLQLTRSSLPIFLYAIEGKPLICRRAFAWALEAELEKNYLLASAFPQLRRVSVEFQTVSL